LALCGKATKKAIGFGRLKPTSQPTRTCFAAKPLPYAWCIDKAFGNIIFFYFYK